MATFLTRTKKGERKMLTSVVVAGFLAMAPYWGIADIPYPEVAASPAAKAECRIAEILADYARTRSATFDKGDLSTVRIDGPRASARLTFPNRIEIVHLERHGDDWRVTRIE
jgi:hypothetical protein